MFISPAFCRLGMKMNFGEYAFLYQNIKTVQGKGYTG